MASADIMLAPSTTETFGNVVLEAMASGLAVVSADAPSARALLVDQQTGFLSDALDVDQYAMRIEALLTNPDLRREIGASARQASEAYSWDAASASVERTYRRVVQGSRCRMQPIRRVTILVSPEENCLAPVVAADGLSLPCRLRIGQAMAPP